MEVKYLNNPVGTIHIDLNSGVLASPPFVFPDCEVDIPLSHNRKSTQSRVAVVAFFQTDIVPRREIRVTELAGKIPRHVYLIGSRSTTIHLLQQYDVGVMVFKNFTNPIGLKATIESNRAVNVVGNNSKIQSSSKFGY